MTIWREELDAGRVDLTEVATGKRIPPAHPGEILREDFLEPMGISVYALANSIKVPRSRVNDIVRGRRAYRAHTSRPITEKTDRVHAARLDLESGVITLDGRPWHQIGALVRWPEVRADAQLLTPYFEGFGHFYGDASGVLRSYWALTCWLYAAPFAPFLRSAALRHDGSPLADKLAHVAAYTEFLSLGNASVRSTLFDSQNGWVSKVFR